MVAYLAKLQQPNGLFFHAPDVHVLLGPRRWLGGRRHDGMLRDLPAKHKARKPVLAAYRKMMATLLTHQAQSGMWRQLIDHPESWEETSSTAMFTYAFVTGVKNGWLPKKPTAPRRARRGSRSWAISRPKATARSVRGHRQEERPAVLPGSPARGGRCAWAGAHDVVGDRAAEMNGDIA